MLALGGLVLAATTVATAAEPSGNSEQIAQRKALYESQRERNLQRRAETAPVTDSTTARPSAAEQRNIAALLLGLFEGLVGGAAAAIGWTISTRARLARPVSGRPGQGRG